MTKTEVAELLALAVANHPDKQKTDLKPTAALWLGCIGHLDYTVAKGALLKVLATSPYWPKVNDILEAAMDFRPSDLPSPEDAWAEFLREKRRHSYYDAPQSMRTPDDSGVMIFSEPWDFTNPVIGQAIKGMYGSWQGCYQVMQDDTLGVDRKHFVDMYHSMTRRDREAAMLPPAVTQLAAELATKLLSPTREKPEEPATGGDQS